VVQTNASDITSRVRGATIRIVDTTTAQSVGSGTTGTQGIDLVRLTTKVAPATLTITATGGRTSTGQPFTSATWTSTSYMSPHAVFVEPLASSPTASAERMRSSCFG